MAKRPARANRMGALVLSLGLVVGLGACSPAHTLDIFDPSDGVRVMLDEDVRATNLLVLTEGEGQPGTLIGSLTNNTAETLTVEVNVDGAAPITVELPAFNTAYLTPKGPEDKGRAFTVDAQVSTVSVAPGGHVNVTLATPSTGSTQILVPVLDGTIEPYSEYLP